MVTTSEGVVTTRLQRAKKEDPLDTNYISNMDIIDIRWSKYTYNPFNISTKEVCYVAQPEIDTARERPVQHIITNGKTSSPSATRQQLVGAPQFEKLLLELN